MPSRRALLTAGAALLAGCAGGPGPAAEPTGSESPRSTPSGTATRSDTDTTPAGGVDFPDGPKERPDRPDDLTRETVREYVRTYEHRYAYNALYANEHTEVSLTCEVLSVETADPGYRVVVRCSGYSNTQDPSGTNATSTATAVHADWGSRRFVYRVTSETTTRRPVER